MRTNSLRRIMMVALTLAAGPLQTEVRVIQSPNGMTGTVTDLGNGVGLQSSPHGEGGVIIAPPESPAPLPPGPHGDLHQRTVTPFQSPSPPNQMTPAPVLPFHPNRPLVPAPSPPTAVAPHPVPNGGRVGR